MSKNKNGGLDQYGHERFGRLILRQSENVGMKRVQVLVLRQPFTWLSNAGLIGCHQPA